jgi:hypothetical protein
MGSLEKVRELVKQYGMPTPLAQHLVHELDRVTKTRGAHYRLLMIDSDGIYLTQGCGPEPRAIIVRIVGETLTVIDYEYTRRSYTIPLSLFPRLQKYIELLRENGYREDLATRKFLELYGSTG